MAARRDIDAATDARLAGRHHPPATAASGALSLLVLLLVLVLQLHCVLAMLRFENAGKSARAGGSGGDERAAERARQEQQKARVYRKGAF